MRKKREIPPMPEAPTNSVINKQESYLDKLERVDDMDFETVHILDIDRRLALISRFILEAALRSTGQLTLKDKADIAIRAINVVEGAKQRVELWQRDMERETPRTVEQYEAERQATEARLRMLLERKGIVTSRQKELTDAALTNLEVQNESA